MASNNLLPAIAKLIGRENFSTWKFAVQTYLEHEELWKAVLGTETDAGKITKAKSKIILLLEPHNYVHVHNCTTAKQVWDNLEAAFDDSGLTRRVGLLRTLATTSLENFDTVEEYVNTIIMTAHRLTAIKFVVSEEWIGTFLLAGLPEEYRPMIMGIESSGVIITGDSIKAKLLQDVKSTNSGSNAFYSFRPNQQRGKGSVKHNQQFTNNGIRCYNCNQYGHRAAECRQSKKKQNQADVNVASGQTSSGFCAGFYGGFCSGFSSGVFNKDDWLIDSGASYHMTPRSDWIKDKYKHSISEITVANDMKLNVTSAGKVVMKIEHSDSSDFLPINGVLHVPDLSANLLSVSQIVSKGFTVNFDVNGCRILDADGNVVATGDHNNNMFKLNAKEIGSCMSVGVKNKSQMELWHQRMGHLNVADLVKLRDGLATGISFSGSSGHNPVCVSCLKGKQVRKPFNNKGTRASHVLELIHSDICGPMETNSLSGARYFYTFIDDYSRKVFVYFLKTRDLAEEVFRHFKVFVENQTGKQIKKLRSDNGGEYISKSYENYLKKCGIHHQTTMSYTPQQNGVAERMNRTLQERSRSMVFNAGLPKSLWAEAVATSAYIINRSPANNFPNVTPEEVWSGNKPDLSHLRVFGCHAMVHVPKEKRKKWDARSNKMIFVGYCEDSKGYRFIHPTTRQLLKSRDVVFLEDIFNGNISGNECDKINSVTDNGQSMYPSVSNDSQIQVEANQQLQGHVDEQLNDQLGNDTFHSIGSEPEDEAETIVLPRRSERPHKQREFPDCVSHFVHGTDLDDPLTVEEAMSRHDSESWKSAMDEEFASLQENKTWELCDLPPDRKPLGCKWVFKTKRDVNGSVLRHKARLVIQGFLQRKGIDYEETFSPVIRYNSIRFLLALSAKFDLDLSQMDAVTAFIQGDVSEEIYMVQPKQYRQGEKVCKLNKEIYGLKQASRLWNIKLDIALREIGFVRSAVDPCVYYKVNGDRMTFVGVYVDDSLIASNDDHMKRFLRTELNKRFKMKDLGEANVVVGIRISRDRQKGEIYIDQEKHIKELLNKFNMLDSNPVSTPSDPNQKLTKEMCPKTTEELEAMSQVPYQELVGSLLYIAQGSRPDITWTVNNLSKFNKNPGQSHWMAAKRVLRYLKGTLSAKLKFFRDVNSNFIGFCDSDYAGDLDDRHSCSGYVFLMQGGSISWCSSKQQTVALSTTEAEYMALSSTVQEALWLRQFFQEFGAGDDGTTINIDSQSALDLALVNGYRKRTKHIDVRHHFLREHVTSKTIVLRHVGTNDMVADILTKPLFTERHLVCAKGLGMIF